jgi:hypothetical protein
LPTILLAVGKVNFTNLSRYSDLSERTYRRHYSQPFAFTQLNQQTIELATAASQDVIGAVDCTFIPKSGKSTYGLDWFHHGSANRVEKGLEVSVIAVIDVAAHQGYTLSVQQTAATAAQQGTPPKQDPPQITPATIAQLRSEFQQLPAKEPLKTTLSQAELEQIQAELQQLAQAPKTVTPTAEVTRVDQYLQQLQKTRPHFPPKLRYLTMDGFYSKQKMVDGVVQLNLHVISKLRVDANLRYLYSGEQKPKGRPRKYDGKVDLQDLSRFDFVKQLSADVHLYTAVVWHVSLKRAIRLALLVDTRQPGKTGYVLLFSTDLELDAEQLLSYYKSRFQIEFIFRDAKQFTGLCDCQSRNAQKLDFHFNASLSALNLAKCETQLRPSPSDTEPSAEPEPFSMASYKRIAFNEHLLNRFITMLDLNPTSIKSHPNYQTLRAYGILAN